jgi:hypothetical protein
MTCTDHDLASDGLLRAQVPGRARRSLDLTQADCHSR